MFELDNAVLQAMIHQAQRDSNPDTHIYILHSHCIQMLQNTSWLSRPFHLLRTYTTRNLLVGQILKKKNPLCG